MIQASNAAKKKWIPIKGVTESAAPVAKPAATEYGDPGNL
jgi:hypothetical protein